MSTAVGDALDQGSGNRAVDLARR